MPRLVITAHAHEFTPAIPSITGAYGLRIFAAVQYEDATYVTALKKEEFTVWTMGNAAGGGPELPDILGIYQVDEHPHKADISEPPPPFYSIVTGFQFPSYSNPNVDSNTQLLLQNPARGTYVFAVLPDRDIDPPTTSSNRRDRCHSEGVAGVKDDRRCEPAHKAPRADQQSAGRAADVFDEVAIPLRIYATSPLASVSTRCARRRSVLRCVHWLDARSSTPAPAPWRSVPPRLTAHRCSPRVIGNWPEYIACTYDLSIESRMGARRAGAGPC
jgi:hypothetical protein